MNTNTALELQSLLNDAAVMCQNANEENLDFVHGFYVGILQGITAMGYNCLWNPDYCRFTVQKDPLKTDRTRVYGKYLARIIQDHFLLYISGQDAQHEQAIMDGMEEVLSLCGFQLVKDQGNGLFSITSSKRPLS